MKASEKHKADGCPEPIKLAKCVNYKSNNTKSFKNESPLVKSVWWEIGIDNDPGNPAVVSPVSDDGAGEKAKHGNYK